MPDERQILEDYMRWEPEKTIDAFLKERGAEADALRIAEAIEILAIGQHNAEQVSDYGNDFAALLNAVAAATNILVEDRPLIDASTLTERRTLLA